MSKLIPWLKERTTKISDSALGEIRAKKLALVEKIKNLPLINYAKIPTGKPLYRYYWFWLLVVASGGSVAWMVFWSSIERSLPEATELYTFIRDDTLTITAGDGSILQQQGQATREQLKLSQMPKKLVQDFIA